MKVFEVIDGVRTSTGEKFNYEDPKKTLCKEKKTSEGITFTKFKDGIIHEDCFEECSAITFDFKPRLSKRHVESLLDNLGVQYILKTSKRNWLYKNSEKKERFHLILPLKTSITTVENFEKYTQLLNEKLFYGKVKNIMLKTTSYLYSSPRNAKLTSKLGDDLLCIDQVDFSPGGKGNPITTADLLSLNVRWQKVKNQGHPKWVYAFDSSNLKMRTLDGEPVSKENLTERSTPIICPFHRNVPSHNANARMVNNNLEIVCEREDKTIFFSKGDTLTSIEDSLETNFEDKFLDAGFFVGSLSGERERYLVHDRKTGVNYVCCQEQFFRHLNRIFKQYYPQEVITGKSYFYKGGFQNRLINLYHNPRNWEEEPDNHMDNLNIASDGPGQLSGKMLASYQKQLKKQGWKRVLEKACPTITLLLQNIVDDPQKADEIVYILTYLKYCTVKRSKASVFLVFAGRRNNGKMLLINLVIKPLLRENDVSEVSPSEFVGQYNDFMAGKEMTIISGNASGKVEGQKIIDKIATHLHREKMTINGKMQSTYSIDSNSNFIWVSDRIPEGFLAENDDVAVFKGNNRLDRVQAYNSHQKQSMDRQAERVRGEVNKFRHFLHLFKADYKLISKSPKNFLTTSVRSFNDSEVLSLLSLLTSADFNFSDLSLPPDATEVIMNEAQERFNTPKGRFISLEVLTELLNGEVEQKKTSRFISKEISRLLSQKPEAQRCGADKKPRKGYYLEAIENSLSSLLGDTMTKYPSLSSSLYTRKGEEQSFGTYSSLLGTTFGRQLFPDRPLLQLSIDPRSVNQDLAESNLDCHLVASRSSDLLTEGDLQRSHVYYKTTTKQETEDLMPLFTQNLLSHSQVNQLFSPGEFHFIVEHFLSEFGIPVQKSNPCLLLEETRGHIDQSHPALRVSVPLPEDIQKKLNVSISLYFIHKDDSLAESLNPSYFAERLGKLNKHPGGVQSTAVLLHRLYN